MIGYKIVSVMVKVMIEELNIIVLVVLYLDYGSYEGVKVCIEVGFLLIMFDGFYYLIVENIEKIKELVVVVNVKGFFLEVEVGLIGGEEDGVVGKGEVVDLNECK